MEMGKMDEKEIRKLIEKGESEKIEFKESLNMENNEKEILVLKVRESSEKPVFFKGNAYKRVGKSNHKINASEIRRLAKESHKSYWDEQICDGTSLDDIDWNFIE